MAGSLNKVMLLGNVGKDPEVRTTQTGMKIVNLTVATEESWKDKSSGERKSRTEWHRVVCFNEGLGGVIEKYVKKGSKIYIEGQLQTRKWTDQQGQDRYSTEIILQAFNGQMILLDGRGGGERSENPAPREERQPVTTRGTTYAPPSGGGDLDDDVPFAPCWQ
jgi:single-strand DNA-binding protein